MPIMIWVTLYPSNRFAKYTTDSEPWTGPKCAMSDWLSTSSRQLVSIFHFTIAQSDHSSEDTWSMRSTFWSAGGGLPSGSFQMNSSLFSSQVVQDLTRALGGMRLAYGILLQTPSAPQLQPW